MKNFNSLYDKYLLEATRSEFPTQNEILDYLKITYPKVDAYFTESDKYGLFTSDQDAIVNKIALCVTITPEVQKYALDNKIDLIIAHHPIDKDISMPHIIFHLPMDSSKRGNNSQFAYKLGLKNIVLHEYTVEGDLYKNMDIDEFLQFLPKHGYEVKGRVWKNPKFENSNLKSVIFAAGGGGMLIAANKLKKYGLLDVPGLDIRNNKNDVYVTGELKNSESDFLKTNFKYIIELGHTISEKPILTWVKNKLVNRWENLQIEIMPNDIDKLNVEHG